MSQRESVYFIWSTKQRRYVRALEGDGDVILACIGQEAARREADKHSQIDTLGMCLPMLRASVKEGA